VAGHGQSHQWRGACDGADQPAPAGSRHHRPDALVGVGAASGRADHGANRLRADRGDSGAFAYSLLLHRTAYIFCLSLPFALAGTLGWWAVLPSALVAYTFFGLDALGDQLEDPFGHDVNDLPLDAMVRVIERDMLSALGQADLPPVLMPVDNVLM
jgi:hypothetical protein